MQVPTDKNAAIGPRRSGPLRRAYESIADFFSPMLGCTACGFESKQRHFATTGAIRTIEGDSAWSRVTTHEIERACPSCGESIWICEDAAYYYPVG